MRFIPPDRIFHYSGAVKYPDAPSGIAMRCFSAQGNTLVAYYDKDGRRLAAVVPTDSLEPFCPLLYNSSLKPLHVECKHCQRPLNPNHDGPSGELRCVPRGSPGGSVCCPAAKNPN